MKYRILDLEGDLLDKAVALAEGYDLSDPTDFRRAPVGGGWRLSEFSPGTRWAQGGPIKEREKIGTRWNGRYWEAEVGEFAFDEDGAVAELGKLPVDADGDTELIAAMRAYVTSKFGHEVDLP